MADHTTPDEPSVIAAEPASITEIVRLIVAALVAVGVIEVDDTTVSALILAIGGLISIGLTFWTRRKVSPLAKPRTDDGRVLVPAPVRPGESRPGDDPAYRPGDPRPGPPAP